MSAQLSDYDYDLPRELIARRPLVRREDSRMMVLHRAGQTIEHRQFREVKTFLQPGDLLVLNDTRVLPARQFSDDGVIEFLFLERMGPARWKCLVKPGRKMRVGATAKIDNVALRVDAITPDGERIVALDEDVDLRVRLARSPRRRPDFILPWKSCVKFRTHSCRCTWARGHFCRCVRKRSPSIACMRSASLFRQKPQTRSMKRTGLSLLERPQRARLNRQDAKAKKF